MIDMSSSVEVVPGATPTLYAAGGSPGMTGANACYRQRDATGAPELSHCTGPQWYEWPYSPASIECAEAGAAMSVASARAASKVFMFSLQVLRQAARMLR